MNGRTPAQVYAFVIGGTLVIAGIIALATTASFAGNEMTSSESP